jgi:undecaprenyl phosphate-alpha-L-ara4N flippase subunit ArnE
MSYVLALCSVVLGTSGQVLLKAGMKGRPYALAALFSPAVLAGFTLYGVAAIIWLKVLTMLPLSTAYPILSLNFILIPLASSRFLGESLSGGKIFGLVLVVSGIIASAR